MRTRSPRRVQLSRRSSSVLAYVVVGLLVCAAASAALAQAPSMDFSDAERPLLQWPFEVIEYWTDDNGNQLFQHSRIKESPSHVYDYMAELKENGSNLGQFSVMGLTRSSKPNNYNVVLGDGNLRYKVEIKPDGTGAELMVIATPRARTSGYFKMAIYGYRLGGDMQVDACHYRHVDE